MADHAAGQRIAILTGLYTDLGLPPAGALQPPAPDSGG